jgi:hypothetical protein
MLIPTVGVYKDATRTMENRPVINQWIPAYSAIHLITSYDITPEKLRFSGDPGFIRWHFQDPHEKERSKFFMGH